MQTPLLSIRDLTIDFQSDVGEFRAVDGLSFDVPRAKTVAIVGESGSGKSVTAQAIMRILPRIARISRGSILFDDPKSLEPPIDIAGLDAEGEAIRAPAKERGRSTRNARYWEGAAERKRRAIVRAQ